MSVPRAMLAAASIEQIENEHRVQLQLLKAFRDACGDPAQREAADHALDRFSAYTDAHFMSEQLLMRLYAYPEIDTHVHEHEQMMEMLLELRHHWSGGDQPHVAAQVELLRTVFIDHMQTRDPAFHDYLTALEADGA